MATGDSARFRPALTGEATRAAGPATPGRPHVGLANAGTDPTGAEDPPYGSPAPGERTGDVPAPPDDDDGALPPGPSQGSDAFAEFEAEQIASESTRIDESEALAEQSTAILDDSPALPYLFVEAGKDRGREYVLQEGETSVGRGIDNDVILADVSVSRKHVRVIREGATITLRDLGSGNGSLVNGRKAHVQVLNEGDRIEIGETVLVLRVPGAAAEDVVKTDAPGATAETALPISGDVPMAPAMGYGAPAPFAPPPYPTSTDSIPLPREGGTRAVVLPRRLAFISAAAVAVLASMIGAGVATYLGRDDTVVSTLPPATTVGTLPTTPIAAPPPTAPIAAAGVPVALPPAPPLPPVAPLAPAAVPGAVPVPGSAAIPAAPGGPPGAAPGTAAVPAPPVAPVATTDAAEPEDEAEDEPDEGGRSGRSGRGGSGPSRAPSGREAALAAYRSASFAEAARLARDAAGRASGRDRRELEQLANDIESFSDLYPRIRDVGDRLSSIEAIAVPAIRLDRSISGGHFTRDLRPRFVDWLVSQGESTFSSDPAGACTRAMRARDLDSSDAGARALFARCETRASDMLAEAGRVERSDASRAQDLYRRIARMLPSSHDTAREAARRLAAVGRSRTVDEDE